MAPSVTALICTYQYGEFLRDSIESVLQQDYDGDIDIIVADDGSTDDTARVVACYPQVRYHRQENTGVAGLVNNALPLATGELVAFHSGDDVWLPNKTALQVEMLAEQPEVGLAFGDMRVVDRDLRLLYSSYWQHAHIRPYRGDVADRIAQGPFVSGCTMMFRAEFIPDVLPIPLGEAWEDWWISRAIGQLAPFDYTDEPLMLYRYHGANRSLYV